MATGRAALGFHVTYYLSSDQAVGGDTEIGSRWVTGLASGASSSVSTVLALPASLTGTYWVRHRGR